MQSALWSQKHLFFWLVSHPFWPALPGGAELKSGNLHMCLGILVPLSFSHKNNLLFEAPRIPKQGPALSLLSGKGSEWAFKKINALQYRLSVILHLFCNWGLVTIVDAVQCSNKKRMTLISRGLGRGITCVLHTVIKENSISPAFWRILKKLPSNPYYPLITYIPSLCRRALRGSEWNYHLLQILLL